MAFLSIQHASKRYAQAAAVEDFNLEVERGELVSFLGPSGCGKTTTLRMVAGFEIPSSGKIELNGVDITNKPPNRRNVGMVFQAYALFPNMTVGHNVAFGLKVAKRPKDEIAGRVKEMLGLIRMPELENRYPHQLSGGQQQRVALARALAVKPQVLLLDEPLSALDAKIRVELRYEIRRIQQELGITTIYVTHDQEEALALSDRVVVMSAGRMEQIGKPWEIYNYPTSTFVAGFVGTLNQLRSRVVDAPTGELDYHGQRFKVSGELPPGETVVAMLRPEQLRMGVHEGENQLTGKLISLAFLGAIVRMGLELGDAIVTLDTLNERRLALPKIGEPLTISFPPHAAWVMAAG
ncbi:MAG: ABC transporter ATP-binding protein [Anaerolineales bacterium]|nr:ABC transporter ATP-binding protein [Anaerolineales bacterium]